MGGAFFTFRKINPKVSRIGIAGLIFTSEDFYVRKSLLSGDVFYKRRKMSNNGELILVTISFKSPIKIIFSYGFRQKERISPCLKLKGIH